MLKIANHPIYRHELPKGHRFPMEKYDLLPQQLIYEGTCTEENFFEPEVPNYKHFFTVHDPEYFFDLLNITLNQKAARKIGFPLSEVLIEREMVIADGTMKASEFAIENGTAEIFRNDASVFTFSMHGKSNYPFIKEKSDLDIALKNATKDAEYLAILKEILPRLIQQEKPDFIYYLCGVDVIETDKLGKLGLTINGCKERDNFVLQTCFDLKIPVMCSMGGGYSLDINIIVNAHANTFRLAQEIYF